MQINKTTDYALRIIYYLSQENRIVPSSEMSRNIHISKRYLLLIAKDLKKHGFISVGLGAVGGYSLARPLSDITFYDVITQMEGKVVLSRCCLQKNCQDGDKPCILHSTYGFLEGIFERYLQSLTLDMLTYQPIGDWHGDMIDKLHAMFCQRTGQPVMS